MEQFKLIQILNKNPLLCEIVQKLQVLRNEGLNNSEIEEVIKKMNLPLNEHLFIFGNFSNLMGVRFQNL